MGKSSWSLFLRNAWVAVQQGNGKALDWGENLEPVQVLAVTGRSSDSPLTLSKARTMVSMDGVHVFRCAHVCTCLGGCSCVYRLVHACTHVCVCMRERRCLN